MSFLALQGYESIEHEVVTHALSATKINTVIALRVTINGFQQLRTIMGETDIAKWNIKCSKIRIGEMEHSDLMIIRSRHAKRHCLREVVILPMGVRYTQRKIFDHFAFESDYEFLRCCRFYIT